eukprot:gene8760-biopygen13148
MRALFDVRCAAFVGAWLHCLAHVRSHHGAAIEGFDPGWDPGGRARFSFHGEFRCALDALNAELGADGGASGILGFSVHDALQTERPKCQKHLSRAVLAQKLSLWKASLDPRSRALTILNTASSEGRRSLASEWLVTAPFNIRTTLPDQHYRMGIRKRLDLPICARGDACQVQRGGRRRTACGDPGPRGRPCGRHLMPDADHAQACATHARVCRHNGIADLCAAIYQEAGHAAHREAEVPGVHTSTKNEPIVADVLVRGRAPAAWECAEVKIRHMFDHDGDAKLARAAHVDEFLRAQEAAVHLKYSPVHVRPWVLTTLGRPGDGLCNDLRRLARMRLQRRDVRRAVSHPSVLQAILHRWRAELSCSLMLGDTGVFMDAVQGGPQAWDGAVRRVDTHLYDLQELRIGL